MGFCKIHHPILMPDAPTPGRAPGFSLSALLGSLSEEPDQLRGRAYRTMTFLKGIYLVRSIFSP
jgi:hypothetical protein